MQWDCDYWGILCNYVSRHLPLSSQATPAFPTQHRSSSDSNLSDMAPPPQPGSGSGPGEEVGVVGSWAMGAISLLPPSLPDSSSTSAESLNLGRHEGDSQQPPFITEGELQYTFVMAQC